jgi:hypothetical protein
MMSPALTPGTPAVSGLIPPFVEPGCRVTSISPRQIVMLFGDLHSKVLNELQGVCVCVCVHVRHALPLHEPAHTRSLCLQKMGFSSLPCLPLEGTENAATGKIGLIPIFILSKWGSWESHPCDRPLCLGPQQYPGTRRAGDKTVWLSWVPGAPI